MREILFRAKAANREEGFSYRTKYKNGDWVYGLLTDCENYAGFAEMTNTDGVTGIEVDKETVGQYTGINDKNGKKIFEGDIVKYNIVTKFSEGEDLEDAEERHECIDTVFFTNGRFRPAPIRIDCEDFWYAWAYDDFEVIGNIHDNPELLRGAI